MANLPHITRCGLPGNDCVPFGMHACHFYGNRDRLLAAPVPEGVPKEARVVIEGWRRHYKARPHSSLGHLTPAEFIAKEIAPPVAPHRQQPGGRSLELRPVRRIGPSQI